MRWWIASVWGLLVLGAPSARAQAPEDALRASISIGEAVSRCVDAPELARRVDDILGRDAVSDHGALRVHVDARPRERGTALIIMLSDASGVRAEREIAHDSASCDALVGTLSVVVALLLDDRAREAALDVTTAVTVAPVIASPTTSEPSDPRARWWIGFGAGAGVAVGLLPDVVPGAELRGEGGEVGGASMALSLTVFPRGVAGGTPGGEFAAFAGALAGCTPRWVDARPLSLAGCAGASAGAIRGVGTGVERAIERLEPLVTLDAYADVALDVARPFGIALRIGIAVPLVRPSFFARIDGERVTIHEPWPIFPTLALSFFLADRD